MVRKMTKVRKNALENNYREKKTRWKEGNEEAASYTSQDTIDTKLKCPIEGYWNKELWIGLIPL